MPTYYHGVRVKENPTRIQAPVLSTAGALIAVGTAPGGTAKPHEPVLATTYDEAVSAIGYDDDWGKYTLCQVIDACFVRLAAGPVVFINCFDPETAKTAFTPVAVTVTERQAVLEKANVLLEGLVVKNGDTALTITDDYVVAYNDDGNVTITLTAGGAGASATSLNVNGYVSDAASVTAADIIGGIDVQTGKETGLEVLRQVYPKLGVLPGMLIAPGWSHIATVGAAMVAKANSDIGGDYKCMAAVDINCTQSGATQYTDVRTKKEAAGLKNPQVIALWPKVKIDDNAYYYSAVYGAVAMAVDAENDSVPSQPISNYAAGITGLCLDDTDNTEVILDHPQANEINSYGVVTAVNINGFKTWGNNTTAYPDTTDPKDRWINCRRLFNWERNNLVVIYTRYVDQPASYRTIAAITDSENTRLNALTAAGRIAGGRVEFNKADNPIYKILDGHLVLNLYISPFVPAEDILFIMEFDVATLEASFNG